MGGGGGEVKLVIAGLLATCLTLGGYDHLFNLQENKCYMTFMYQKPHFIRIELGANASKTYPSYGLYVYGEGDLVKQLESKIYDGIPVLFVPGNGGSHKQVRSLASVAYRKSLDDNTGFHFNFFTVDLNEELAALHGPVLERQTSFVALAVRHILSLYAGQKNRPTSVILVGHSMGGMVARAVYTTKLVTASTAPLIITQATPHTRPVLVLDPHIQRFYDKVNTYWAMERGFDLKEVVLVSVGGGRNDIQVPTSHTHTSLADLSTTTANIPSCWLTADHQAVVWCWQLVMGTVRAMFDSIDISTSQLTTNRSHIVNVFSYHFATKITGKRYKSSGYPDSLQLDKEGVWMETNKRQFTHTSTSTPRHTYLSIPLRPTHPHHHTATLVVNNVDAKNWVFACTAAATTAATTSTSSSQKATNMCTTGKNLSPQTQKMLGKMKSVEVDLSALSKEGHTHLVINIPPTDEKVGIAVDIHSREGRHRISYVPSFLRSFLQTLVVDTTPQNALAYNVSLRGLSESWQSLKLTLKPRQGCKTPEVPLARLYVPWADKVIYLHNSGPGVSYIAELDIPAFTSNATPSIQFYLNPDCTYSILLQGSLIGVFRRLVLLYGYQIPTYCAVHILLSLSKQFKGIASDGYCPSFFTSMLSLSPIAVVPFVKLANILLSNLEIQDDLTILGQHGEDLPLLPIVLFLGGLPLTLLLGAATWGLILLAGKGAQSFVTKVLGRSLGAADVMADLAVTGLARMPVIVGAALISLAYSTCGSLSLCLATVFYFLKVSKQYEEYIERAAAGLIPGPTTTIEAARERSMSRLHFHLTMLMLLGVVTTLNLPTLVIWTRLARGNLQLTDDPSREITVAILVSLSFLWQKKMPQPSKRFYQALSYTIHTLAIISILFASIHIYRVAHIIAATMALTAAHQLLAPSSTTPNGTDSSDGTETETEQPYMEELTEGGKDSDLTPSSDLSSSVG